MVGRNLFYWYNGYKYITMIFMHKFIISMLIMSVATLGVVAPVTVGAQEPEVAPSFEIDLESLDDPIYDSAEEFIPQQQRPLQEYYKARVIEIVESGITEYDQSPYQVLVIEFLSGDTKGSRQTIDHGRQFGITEAQLMSVGDAVIVNKIQMGDQITFSIVDRYRLGAVGLIFAAFFLLTIIFAGRKGFTAIIGLGLSVGVIVYYIIPQIIAGANPMTVSLIGAVGIMVITLYLAHGFNARTSVALLASLVTLSITVFVANAFVYGTHLLGLGSEEAFLLQYDLTALNLQGLLLGGIMIGVLGVLDDITTAQAAAVYELKRANHRFDFKELYARGVLIGKEHITSLVNTLALAYVGAALPLLLLVYINLNNNLWVIANSELIVEEVIRTLVGSSALILAVPITTFIAAWYFGKKEHLEPIEGHAHVH